VSKKQEEHEAHDGVMLKDIGLEFAEFSLEDLSTDPFFSDPNVIFSHRDEAMKMYLRCDNDEDQE
jgi:hypothetical protein